uniref:Putative secreted protein n=1 Tax=Amblyomma cajennense TaxID=34607 RepID=A0A023FBV3_AMBCJ
MSVWCSLQNVRMLTFWLQLQHSLRITKAMCHSPQVVIVSPFSLPAKSYFVYVSLSVKLRGALRLLSVKLRGALRLVFRKFEWIRCLQTAPIDMCSIKNAIEKRIGQCLIFVARNGPK